MPSDPFLDDLSLPDAASGEICRGVREIGITSHQLNRPLPSDAEHPSDLTDPN
jgi:hypothetical protein